MIFEKVVELFVDVLEAYHNQNQQRPKRTMASNDYLTLQKAYSKKRSEDLINELNPFGEMLFSRQWKWNNQNGQSQKNKSLTQQGCGSMKQEILVWFQNLSPSDKIASTAIHNPQFINAFITVLPQQQSNKIFNLPSSKTITLSLPHQDSFFDELLHNLRIACLCDPILYFSNCQIMGLRMLEWLNRVSNSKIFEYAQKGRQGEQNILWFNSSSYHSLQKWFANQLEISIVKNYFNKSTQPFYLHEFTAFLATNGKKTQIDALQMELGNFSKKSTQDIAHLRAKIKEEQDRFSQFKQQELIHNMDIVNQHKKRGRKRQKKRNDLKKQPEESKNIAQQEPEGAIQQVEDIKKEVLPVEQIFQEDAQNMQGKQSPKVTSPTKQEDNAQQKSQKKPIQKPNNKNQQMNSKSSPPKRKLSSSKNLIYVSPKRTRSPQNVRVSEMLQMGDIKSKYSEQDRGSSKIAQQSSETNFSQQITEQKDYLNKRRRRKCKKQNEQFRQARRSIWSRLVTRQLDNIVDQLSTQTNSLYQLKIIAFERVRVYIQSLYPVANPILFGSNAVGLSLPNSDVDILLFGLPCQYKEEASDILAQIAVQINAMGWVVSCSTYLNAKVPIVKLQIDPSIPFLQTKRKQDLFRVYNPMALYYLDTNKTIPGYTIKVDITININGVTSVGYESTLFMKNWITRMPEIQRLIILFKYILSIRGFNSNFNGGIGSYCLFAMIAAFMKNNSSHQELSINFVNILKWYGQEFDNLSYVVWLREIGPCFVNEQQLNIFNDDGKKSYLRLVDPITQKMMNSSCNEYNNIKAEFRRILSQLNDVQNTIDDYLKENDVTTAELTKTLQTKKGLQKIVTRFESKYSPSIRAIIDRSN